MCYYRTSIEVCEAVSASVINSTLILVSRNSRGISLQILDSPVTGWVTWAGPFDHSDNQYLLLWRGDARPNWQGCFEDENRFWE